MCAGKRCRCLLARVFQFRTYAMKPPKVSVVMAVYNAEKYLRQAIESILGQSFGDFELLINDDGSTDTSAEIIQSFRAPRIRVVQNPVNRGAARVRNQCLRI